MRLPIRNDFVLWLLQTLALQISQAEPTARSTAVSPAQSTSLVVRGNRWDIPAIDTTVLPGFRPYHHGHTCEPGYISCGTYCDSKVAQSFGPTFHLLCRPASSRGTPVMFAPAVKPSFSCPDDHICVQHKFDRAPTEADADPDPDPAGVPSNRVSNGVDRSNENGNSNGNNNGHGFGPRARGDRLTPSRASNNWTPRSDLPRPRVDCLRRPKRRYFGQSRQFHRDSGGHGSSTKGRRRKHHAPKLDKLELPDLLGDLNGQVSWGHLTKARGDTRDAVEEHDQLVSKVSVVAVDDRSHATEQMHELMHGQAFVVSVHDGP